MLLLEPEPTAFDLHFRIFGIPVRVHPWFWIVTALLGSGGRDEMNADGLKLLVLWVACVFVSILIHELGHVLVGRLFGTRGHIVLYGFGGLAIGSSDLPSRWKRIAVYFAGPAAQLLLLPAVMAAGLYLGMQEHVNPFLVALLGYLFFINFFWPVLNLLPIWPLDGGKISYDFLGWLLPRNGTHLALGLSLVVAGSLAAFLASKAIWFSALFFGLLALGSYQAMQAEARPRYLDDEPWR